MIGFKMLRRWSLHYLIQSLIFFQIISSSFDTNSSLTNTSSFHNSSAYKHFLNSTNHTFTNLNILNKNNSKEVLKGQEQAQRSYLDSRNPRLTPFYSPFVTPGLIQGPLSIPFGQFIPGLGLNRDRIGRTGNRFGNANDRGNIPIITPLDLLAGLLPNPALIANDLESRRRLLAGQSLVPRYTGLEPGLSGQSPRPLSGYNEFRQESPYFFPGTGYTRPSLLGYELGNQRVPNSELLGPNYRNQGYNSFLNVPRRNRPQFGRDGVRNNQILSNQLNEEAEYDSGINNSENENNQPDYDYNNQNDDRNEGRNSEEGGNQEQDNGGQSDPSNDPDLAQFQNLQGGNFPADLFPPGILSQQDLQDIQKSIEEQERRERQKQAQGGRQQNEPEYDYDNANNNVNGGDGNENIDSSQFTNQNENANFNPSEINLNQKFNQNINQSSPNFNNYQPFKANLPNLRYNPATNYQNPQQSKNFINSYLPTQFSGASFKKNANNDQSLLKKSFVIYDEDEKSVGNKKSAYRLKDQSDYNQPNGIASKVTYKEDEISSLHNSGQISDLNKKFTQVLKNQTDTIKSLHDSYQSLRNRDNLKSEQNSKNISANGQYLTSRSSKRQQSRFPILVDSVYSKKMNSSPEEKVYDI